MIRVQIDKQASDALLRVMEKAPSKIKGAVATGLLRIGFDARSKAISLAPYKTGHLRRSLNQSFRSGDDFVVFGSNLEYARIHDQGGDIPAQTIRPKRAKALRFFIGGKAVFAKRAKIPARRVRPYKGRGYLTPAFEEMKKGKAVKIMNEELFNLIKA